MLQNAIASGVSKIIIPGASAKDLPRAIEISEKYDFVYFAVGIHPYDIGEFNDEIFEFASHPKCVAIGECGLDYYRLPDNEMEKEKEIALQKKVFTRQIEIAKRFKKPLIVHIRDASHDSKTILLENNAHEVGGVLHCFNASKELLSLAESGFYFGIGGVLTFSNAKKLVEILPYIPLEKLVVETDAPYLTPHPFRGSRNEPSYTALVVKKIAELLEFDEEYVSRLTTTNALRLFGEIK